MAVVVCLCASVRAYNGGGRYNYETSALKWWGNGGDAGSYAIMATMSVYREMSRTIVSHSSMVTAMEALAGWRAQHWALGQAHEAAASSPCARISPSTLSLHCPRIGPSQFISGGRSIFIASLGA
jgi:hypothetical protein